MAVNSIRALRQVILILAIVNPEVVVTDDDLS